MLDKVKAGAGGPVASTGETLCTEAQTDLIQGRYNPKEIRNSQEYKKSLQNVQSVFNGSDKRAKTALQKELNNISDKMGYYGADGQPDYKLAMNMKRKLCFLRIRIIYSPLGKLRVTFRLGQQ